jgi:hypothetical protein
MIEDIKNPLWATADKLRANMDAAEYKLSCSEKADIWTAYDQIQTYKEQIPETTT